MKPQAAHTSTLLAALLLAIAPPVAAQEGGASLKEKIDKAIKDYEAVRKDKTKLRSDVASSAGSARSTTHG